MSTPATPSRDPIALLEPQLHSDKHFVRGRALGEVLTRLHRNVAPRDWGVAHARRILATETDPWPATCAARILEVFGPAGEGTAAWNRLLQSQDPRMVAEACHALAHSSFAPALIRILQTRTEHQVLVGVLCALGRFRDTAAFEPIAACLANPNLRPHAVQALRHLGDPRSLPLLDSLKSDATVAWTEDHGPDVRVSDLVTQAIKEIRSMPPPKPGGAGQVVPSRPVSGDPGTPAHRLPGDPPAASR